MASHPLEVYLDLQARLAVAAVARRVAPRLVQEAKVQFGIERAIARLVAVLRKSMDMPSCLHAWACALDTVRKCVGFRRLPGVNVERIARAAVVYGVDISPLPAATQEDARIVLLHGTSSAERKAVMDVMRRFMMDFGE